MPPKQTITKKEMTEAALRLVGEQGMQSLTARNMAQELGLSTCPIYFHFASMEELKHEVMVRACDLMISYISKPYTEWIFLNMGTGLAFFARDHKILYRLLFMENDAYKDILDEFMATMREKMKKDPLYTHLSQEERNDLLDKMWMFTHGLASLICVGLIENRTDEFIHRMIKETGASVIATVMRKKGRAPSPLPFSA